MLDLPAPNYNFKLYVVKPVKMLWVSANKLNWLPLSFIHFHLQRIFVSIFVQKSVILSTQLPEIYCKFSMVDYSKAST